MTTAASVFKERGPSNSFGPIGYIAPASSDRLKGLIGTVRGGVQRRISPLYQPEHVYSVARVVEEGRRRMLEGAATRLSIRTIATEGMIDVIRSEMQRSGATVEATVPVTSEASMVYIGLNLPSRTEGRGSPQHPTESSGFINEGGSYTTRIYDNRNGSEMPDRFVHEAVAMLSSFGYSPSEAFAVIKSENNIIGISTREDLSGRSPHILVGISVAERTTIQLTTGIEIHLVEMTDGKVRPEHRGNGIYYELSTDVINYLIQRNVDGLERTNLIFAESNRDNLNLMGVAHRQGRNFVGLLRDHVEIDGTLKNFEVTFLNRGQLQMLLPKELRG